MDCVIGKTDTYRARDTKQLLDLVALLVAAFKASPTLRSCDHYDDHNDSRH
jgi:hypothetical protein